MDMRADAPVAVPYALLQLFPFCFVFFLTQNDVTADFTIVSVTAAYRTPRCEST